MPVAEDLEHPVEDRAVTLDEVVSMVTAAHQVVLLAHVNPDADALGSALALGLALHRRGAEVHVSFGAPERPAESLRDLDDSDDIPVGDALDPGPGGARTPG